MEFYQGFKDEIGPIKCILIYDPRGEVDLSASKNVKDELDIKFLHLGNLSKDRMDEITKCGFKDYDISNGSGDLSIERILDVIPSMGISSIMTEGTNEIARFLTKRKLVDAVVHVILPIFDGKDLRVMDEGVDLKDPRTVTMGDTTVYFSSGL